ncbi:DUF6056 family protein [uncultured Lentilactobacillus sp.]|uniref:DUF6056 family protein n=1 Tax=uncultured Lentilactobacillus sp. TaxID=2805375 RepID=UPI0025966C93|nr:DUF6056 family protein [uncultured Lentilactobacillus sp.]
MGGETDIKKNSLWNSRAVLYLYLAVIFVVMFIWSYVTPYLDDDWVLRGASAKKILNDGVKDYFYWNGRFFGQSFTRIVLAHGKVISSILTATAFTFMMFLLLKLSKTYTNGYLYKYRAVLVGATVLIFTPGFAQVFLWRSGIGNYLFVTVFHLLFLYLFTLDDPTNFIVACTSFIGFVAGWGSENTSGAIILFGILFIILNVYKNNKLPVRKVVELFTVICGYLCLIFSPGSKVRMIQNDYKWLHTNFFKRSLQGFLNVNSFIYHHVMFLTFIIVVISVMIAALFFWKEQVDYLLGVIYIISGFAAIYVLSFSPEGYNVFRPYLGGFILLLIGMFVLIPKHFNTRVQNYVWLSTTTAMLIFGFFYVTAGIQQSISFNSELEARIQYIKTQRDRGAKLVKVEPITDVDYNNSFSIGNVFAELYPNKTYKFPNNVYKRGFKIDVELNNR